MGRCRYYIEIETEASITITDIGIGMSVLAELGEVVKELHKTGILKTKKLFFYDHNGRLDEVMHDGKGKYKGIRL